MAGAVAPPSDAVCIGLTGKHAPVTTDRRIAATQVRQFTGYRLAAVVDDGTWSNTPPVAYCELFNSRDVPPEGGSCTSPQLPFRVRAHPARCPGVKSPQRTRLAQGGRPQARVALADVAQRPGDGFLDEVALV